MTLPDGPPPNWQWSRESEPGPGRQADEAGWFAGHRLASWPFRVAAGLVDYGLFFFLPWGVLHGTQAAWVVAIALTMWNSGYMAAHTGQSLGKKMVGIRMVWCRRGRDGGLYVVPVPVGIGFLRVALHVLDYSCCLIGFFLPLINRSSGTLADYVTRTLCFRDERLPEATLGVQGRVEWV